MEGDGYLREYPRAIRTHIFLLSSVNASGVAVYFRLPVSGAEGRLEGEVFVCRYCKDRVS